MPNIAAMLKDEISRLSRKEIRRQMLPVRRASTAHRKHIASLKREVSRLEKLVASLSRRAPAAAAAQAEGDGEGAGQRFQARGLVSLRKRLGLSAAELAKLVGVSAQSVYNWEHRKASPRRSQIAQIAQLRGLGKKEARARLEGAASEAPPATRKARARKASAKKRGRRKAK
jgi:DNA-binding transcriptional regulator YiaG